jgi:ribulose-phosphate 3-epimerase
MIMPNPANTALVKRLKSPNMIAEFSMWSANLLRLEEDMARIAPHADVLHIDVADGHFAPAMLFFPDLVSAMKKKTALPIHVHLMTADNILLSQIDQFAEAGADLISVQLENKNLNEALTHIANVGKAAGIVLKYDTPVAGAAPYLGRISFLTLLGTAIGVKGQSLSPAACPRLIEAKNIISAAGKSETIILAADGGIRENTVPELHNAGAETVVLGSLAFGADDLSARIKWLKSL